MSFDLNALARALRVRNPGLMDSRRTYAVLVPLGERDGALHLHYEDRARTLRRQPGDGCFPGGRLEAGATPEDCALRESYGPRPIPPEKNRLQSSLAFIAHRASFLMQPVLGLVDATALADMRPSPAEVDQVFFVPLSHLLEAEPIVYEYDLIPTPAESFPYELIGIPRDYQWQLGHENVPVYPWQGRAIWGLTGRITRNLIQIAQSGGLPPPALD